MASVRLGSPESKPGRSAALLSTLSIFLKLLGLWPNCAFARSGNLIEGNNPLELGINRLSTQFGVNERTVRRWIRAYRKNPEVTALLPRPRGPRPGLRRLPAESERLLTVVIDDWAARNERLPVSWIVEECRRRAHAAKTLVPGRSTVEARLRDRGLEGLYRRYADRQPNADAKPAMPNAQRALEIVQIDHTLVDVMVVDATPSPVRRSASSWQWPAFRKISGLGLAA